MKRRFGPYSFWRLLAMLIFAVGVGGLLTMWLEDGGAFIWMVCMALFLLLLAVDALAPRFGAGRPE